MRLFAIAGVVPLCLVLGLLALRLGADRTLRLSGFERAVLAPALGAGLLTPVFVILGVSGGFSPAVIGWAGWSLALAGALFHGARWMRLRIGTGDKLALALAALFVAAALPIGDEPWGAGRDQQVYAEFATALSTRGVASVSLPGLDAADRDLVAEVGGDREVGRHLGVVYASDGPRSTYTSFLLSGWPVWLAFAHAALGDGALAAANAMLTALGALLLYVLARPIVGGPLAVGVAGAYLALPSTLWIAGTTLAEPLALVLWLALAALLLAGGQRAPVLTSMVAFCAATVRVDSLAIVPVVIAALMLDTAARRTGASARARLAAFALGVGVIAALAWYQVLHPAYLAHHQAFVGAIVLTTMVVVVAIFLPANLGGLAAGGASASIPVRIGAIVAVVLAFAYAALLRPASMPFSLISNGTGLDGTRDFREDSLLNLAAYTGWPMLGLALAGLCSALWRWPQPGVNVGQRVLLAVTLAFSVLYLWFPLVSPDHPWAVRRFVPVVIPGVVLFAGYALHSVVGRRGPLAVLGGVALICMGVLATIWHGAGTLTLRENAGVGQSISDLANGLPDALVVSDLPMAELAGALLVAKGKPVLVTDLRQEGARIAVLRWMESKSRAGTPAWLLHASELSLAGLRTQEVSRRTIARQFAAPASRAPAREVATQKFDAVLTRVDGRDRDALFRRFGATPTWGVGEAGFLASESTAFGVLRLTDGLASLRIPADAAASASALRLDLFLWSPTGKGSRVQIRFDGREQWDGTVASGVNSIKVRLPPRTAHGDLHMEIVSETFEARSLDPGDRRGAIGVALIGVTLERTFPEMDSATVSR